MPSVYTTIPRMPLPCTHVGQVKPQPLTTFTGVCINLMIRQPLTVTHVRQMPPSPAISISFLSYRAPM